MIGEAGLRAYREARRAGYPPQGAAYLARPAVVALESDGNAVAWDAGEFVHEGRRFSYRIEWDDNCLCLEEPEDREDVAELEHRGVIVTLGDAGESVWSVCGDRRTWLGRLSDDRHLAEVARDLADELLRQESEADERTVREQRRQLFGIPA